MPTIHRLLGGLGLLMAAAALPALAQPEARAALQLRSLAASCAACHGTDGRAPEGAAVPGLAGMPAGYLAEQMKAFKAGTRPATVMPQLARGYSDAQIEQLAAYFAARPKR
ncbi:MAG: c-type cytochrome [Burkholderiaceae bacterium]